LLAASINFYLDGFILQAVISFLVALAAVFMMGKNIACGIGKCKTKIKEEESDDN